MNHSETITPKWKVKRQRLSSFLNPNQARCYWPHFCILLVLFMTLYICSFLIYKKKFSHFCPFPPFQSFLFAIFFQCWLYNFVLFLLLSSFCEMILSLRLCFYMSNQHLLSLSSFGSQFLYQFLYHIYLH